MDMMTTTEAARFIGVSRGTILNYIKTGDFAPAYKLSARKTLFDRNDVEKWLNSRVRTK